MLVEGAHEARHHIGLGAHTHRPADQAGDVAAPLVVQPLGHTGAATALGAGPVLPSGEELCLHGGRLGGEQLTTIRPWHVLPQRVPAGDAAVAQEEAEHLARQAGDGAPEVAVAPPHVDVHHERGDFPRVAPKGGNARLAQPGACRLLFSVRRMVSRLPLSRRATARGERRSVRAAARLASFAGVAQRSRG